MIKTKKKTTKETKTDPLPMTEENSPEKYSWSQEFKEVKITFASENGFNAKQVKYRCTRDHVIIEHAGEVLLDGDFFDAVLPDQVYWYLDGKSLVFFFSKASGQWWESAIKGHSKVDVRTLAENKAVTNIDDLGADEKKVIEEMVWKQGNKKCGIDQDDGVMISKIEKKDASGDNESQSVDSDVRND